MCNALLNETLFFAIGQARTIVTRWIDDFHTKRSHFSLRYATRAAVAPGLEQQRADLALPVASPALLRNNAGR